MKRATGPTPSTVDAVWERDGGSCARCGKGLTRERRGQDWSIHHRRPRGSGGTSLTWVNQPANLVTLCGHATTPGSCHQWVENNRSEAVETGWLVSRLGISKPAEIAVWHARHGFVRLLDDGTTTPG